MISYKELNKYLDNIELPKTIEEILSYKHELEAEEFRFIDGANEFLRAHESYATYKVKEAHCLGTCLTDFTRVGVYFLLEDEIVTVNTSNLNKKVFKWEVFHYPFSEIDDLHLVLEDGMDETDYEAGVLYLKVLDHRGTVRTRVIRNVNPRHFYCFEKFHTNIRESKNISGS